MSDIKEEAEKKKVHYENIKHDFKIAKSAKTEIDDKIAEWNDLYVGKMKNKENRSKYVAMELAKQIEYMKPNITEPFTNSSHPIRISTTKNEKRARIQQKYLNNEFTSELGRVEFMEQLADIKLREGTVWVKTAWNYKEENKREVIEHVTMEEILQRGENPDKITQGKNGKFTVEYNNIRCLKNSPDAIICRNEHIFPDPDARSHKELRYLCYRKHMTLSQLKESGKVTDDMLEKLKTSMNAGDDTSLGSDRDSKAQSYGYKESANTKDVERQKVSIIEYYGYYDLNGDGIAEPVIAAWAEKQDVNLYFEENYLPNSDIPFYNDVYSAVPFSLWGNGVGFFIKDDQNAKTGIMRGIFDNMALANNGQKFIKQGTLDYINFKRMRNGEKHIFVNKEGGIEDGKFNQLPQSIQFVLGLVDKEVKEHTGVDAGSQSVSSANNSEDSSGQLTLAQQRMAGMITSTSELLGKVFNDWLKMAEVFLNNEQIQALFTESEQQDIMAFEESEYTKVSFKVATNAQRQIRLQQLNMLMQQAKALGQSMPAELINELVAEMFELFDMYDKAEALRTYKPEPTEQEIAMQQLELQALQLANGKTQAEINELNAKAQSYGFKAQTEAVTVQANAEYKQAQSNEKNKKAQTHDINNAMAPAKFIADTQNKIKGK